MRPVVLKSGRRTKRVFDVVQQRILVGSTPRAVRHLESAVHANAIAVRVERDERVGDVTDGDRRGQDVHHDALGVEDDPDALRDIQVYLDLRDAFPFGAGLRDQTPELVGGLVALPVSGLDGHAPRPGGDVLRNGYAERAGRVRACGRPRR